MVIYPSQKIIEGVVYYEVIVGPTSDLETWIPDTVKPGMTADLTIQTALKENVLIVPEKAIQEKNGKTLVQIFQAGKIQEQTIETGLWGSNDLVEVVSGLEEGEQVVIMP
ncbi:hypothetical protein AMJ50_01700 [Parcubacteria bacterium DG_74_3]|nr:MAG: hypothetical protein AMJ50_01700 [Parcubacteria bacterium DG_74_3]